MPVVLQVVLQLMSLGVDDVLNFDYMDKPPEHALVAALELLHSLGPTCAAVALRNAPQAR